MRVQGSQGLCGLAFLKLLSNVRLSASGLKNFVTAIIKPHDNSDKPGDGFLSFEPFHMFLDYFCTGLQ
jgi:hypothetical protein